MKANDLSNAKEPGRRDALSTLEAHKAHEKGLMQQLFPSRGEATA